MRPVREQDDFQQLITEVLLPLPFKDDQDLALALKVLGQIQGVPRVRRSAGMQHYTAMLSTQAETYVAERAKDFQGGAWPDGQVLQFLLIKDGYGIGEPDGMPNVTVSAERLAILTGIPPANIVRALVCQYAFTREEISRIGRLLNVSVELFDFGRRCGMPAPSHGHHRFTVVPNDWGLFTIRDTFTGQSAEATHDAAYKILDCTGSVYRPDPRSTDYAFNMAARLNADVDGTLRAYFATKEEP